MKEFLDKFLYNIVPMIPIVIMAAVSLWCYNQCDGGRVEPKDTLSVRVDSFIDTVYVEIHDSFPVLKKERVLCYVKIPVIPEHEDSVMLQNPDSVNMTVVQRQYSDDSTYTAYVSGLLYEDWPKLDSVIVRQRTVTKMVTETVTIQRKASRWNVIAGVGYGYGFGYKGFEPYLGVTIGYRIVPP